MCKPRILDDLPPEVLSLVLSQLLPQDMMVPRCSRRWRDKDLDVLYWKQLFLNTFGEAAQTTKRTRKAAKARRPRGIKRPPLDARRSAGVERNETNAASRRGVEEGVQAEP